jgi:hypothetical protein
MAATTARFILWREPSTGRAATYRRERQAGRLDEPARMVGKKWRPHLSRMPGAKSLREVEML